MQNEFLHNIKHVELHGLADIYIEFHLGNDSDDGEDYSSSIRDLLLYEQDIDDQRIFHSIERTMKANTIHALFSKQNDILCNSILSDLDARLTTKFSDAMHRFAFHKESDVRIFISTVEQRKTQDQVKLSSTPMHHALPNGFALTIPMKPHKHLTQPQPDPLNVASI
jgi:hypothetical protein